MKIDVEKIREVLTADEITVLGLRSLYTSYGYERYKMSKFEEYDLYAKNKDYLVSHGVITFTDTDGSLMALKPDVTLSIVKNGKDGEGITKVCYNENVYRVSKGTRAFREIMQVGIECIGNIAEAEVTEVVYLAAKSLESISDEWCLELSDLDIVSSVISALSLSAEGAREVLSALSGKNRSQAETVLDRECVPEENRVALWALFDNYGDADTVVRVLSGIDLGEAGAAALADLKSVVSGVKAKMENANLRVDFSLSADTKYYNGIAFSGFVAGAPTAVLSGGRYDNLMKRMKRRDRAVGFAVYLDELENLPR